MPTNPTRQDLDNLIALHKEMFGGWRMMSETPPPAGDSGEQVAPPDDKGGDGDNIDWKAEARKWETRSKENHSKAKANEQAAARLAELEEANKTEAQKIADRAAKAEQAEKDAATRAAKAERSLAVYLNAGDADPARLLKNVDFLDAISDLAADDIAGIKKAITAAVKESPWLKRVGITGGDTGAGHGRTPENVQPGTGRLAAAFDAQYQQ